MSYTFLATGDIAPDRPDPDECFSETRHVLSEADIALGQLETSFASKGTRLPQARHAVLTAPEAAQSIGRAGYDIISCAGNHCLDWGPEALAETIENLNAAGVSVVGAGENILVARKPVITELPDGTRIAVLAYSSILPQDYWATESRAGCAPMRAHTVYEQIEHDQPGTPARIHTFAHQEDLLSLRNDIRSTKASCDLVFVSMHWGIHFIRATIADYQREVARAAIRAGADAVFGHHAHILKGVEFIQGKPVFHSLCNFACDLRMDPEHAARKSFKEIQKLGENWEPDFGSLYNFPPASRLSMIAKLDIADGKVTRTGFLPLFIDRDAIPRIQTPENPQFQAVIDYLRDVTQEAGLNGEFEPSGDFVEARGNP
ncbi:MAG: poly-gamma-glutamate biosynthesis protein [Ponticaulis sp.]|nr:poly-gamma-glutamate biosynthesis protein [Ponticaulis sp.]|tara:strand:- start:20924 stop:22045 length:1122 start_codon:yes stop_codon:yes gene_type:complete